MVRGGEMDFALTLIIDNSLAELGRRQCKNQAAPPFS